MSETKWTPGPWKSDGDVVGWLNGMAPAVRVSYQRSPTRSSAVCMAWNLGVGDSQAIANAALIAAAPDLYAALQSVIEFFPLTANEGSTERFERIADTFRRETGYLRPGKDCRLHSDEEREARWDKWHAARITAARAALAKARGGE